MADDFLSFKLPEDFIAQYQDRQVPWGFPIGGGNYIGEVTFISKYSRRKEDGTKEKWWETCKRVIEGMFSIQKDWCKSNRLPWNERKAQGTAQDAYERLFTGKWTPPGRGLWMMGTEFVNGNKNSAALQNCAYISTEHLSTRSINDAILPFVRLMEMSMLGVGVGFDTKGAGKLQLHSPEGDAVDYVIEDSREGWCNSVAALLESFFFANREPLNFVYDEIRPAGEPIRGFGGIAAGPTPLIALHDKIRAILGGRAGETITSTDIVDIMNLIGKCVVAGNVRRSAEIAIGADDDKDFLDLKNWEVNPVRMGADGWGHTSNNSVFAEVGGNYDHLVDRIAMNGEPGFLYLDLCRKYGRLIDPPNNKDYRAAGTNPSLRAGTKVYTSDGIYPIEQLDGQKFYVRNLHGDLSPAECFYSGNKPLWKITLSNGAVYYSTAEHKWAVTSEAGNVRRVRTDDLKVGYHFPLVRPKSLDFGSIGSYEDGFFAGWLYGDGWITERSDTGERQFGMITSSEEDKIRNVLEAHLHEIGSKSNFSPNKDHWEFNTTSHALAGWADAFGIQHKSHGLPETVWTAASEDFRKGVIDGLFSSDGCFGEGIQFSTSHLQLAQDVQELLGFYGIRTHINKQVISSSSFPNGKDYQREYVRYSVRARDQRDIEQFRTVFSLTHDKKQDQLNSLNKNRKSEKDPTIIVRSVELTDLVEDVWDISVYDDTHCFQIAHSITGNCGEQTLESFECCTLVETFPIKHENLEDYKKTLKVAYLYAKAVTLLPTHWPETNSIMQRNRRIGCSISGVAQFAEKHGWAELKTWLNNGYGEVQRYDTVYSDWLGVRQSIKTTSVKPSGTVSLLFGVTPGVHWPTADVYIRRLRLAVNDPLLDALTAAGYKSEPDVMDPKHTVCVELPTLGADVRTEKEVSIWEKAHLAVLAQRYWADNQVSVTVTFGMHEKDQIGALLRATDGQLKSVSFLPIDDNAYPQMPYERISEDVYNERIDDIKAIEWDMLYAGAALDAEGEKFCNNDVCII